MKLFIKKMHKDAVLPTRDHHDDAGMDLYTYSDYIIAPGQSVKIPVGIALEIPYGYVGLIWDKSGIGAKGIKTLGGVVDAGYRGEVNVVVHNLNKEPFVFEKGMKVAQMIIQKVEFPEIVEAEELSDSKRGTGGFGSTGK